MKYHLTGFTASALFHASLLLLAVPWLLWQDKLGKLDEPQPVQLSLAQFQPAPQPAPAEMPESKPEPPLPPKPEPPPKPKAEPPKPKPKPANKPKPVPKPKTQAVAKPIPKPVQQAHQHEHVIPQPARPPAPAAPEVAARPQPAPTPTRAAPAQQADNQAAEAAYRARLQAMIASRKRYPPQAADDEAEGTVMVAFTVSANGSISGARVAHSSGNSWLDKAALQAVNAVSGALPFPPEIHKQQWAFSLAVKYQLE